MFEVICFILDTIELVIVKNEKYSNQIDLEFKPRFSTSCSQIYQRNRFLQLLLIACLMLSQNLAWIFKKKEEMHPARESRTFDYPLSYTYDRPLRPVEKYVMVRHATPLYPASCLPDFLSFSLLPSILIHMHVSRSDNKTFLRTMIESRAKIFWRSKYSRDCLRRIFNVSLIFSLTKLSQTLHEEL